MSYGATDRGSWCRVEWKYDAMGRRVRQTSYVLTNGVWRVVEDLKFVSDPELFARHIAELNATNNAPVRAYVWGLDLSETLDGAEGVGGLLWVRMATGPAAGTHFVTYDGNGNVWNLVSATTGTETARYEYGPFGEPLRLSGPAARSNPFRFSTKRTEDFTGLVLYEYRVYNPSTGRWLSRDPLFSKDFDVSGMNDLLSLGELWNLYALCGNAPTMWIDKDGRLAVTITAALIGGACAIGAAVIAYYATGCLPGDKKSIDVEYWCWKPCGACRSGKTWELRPCKIELTCRDRIIFRNDWIVTYDGCTPLRGKQCPN